MISPTSPFALGMFSRDGIAPFVGIVHRESQVIALHALFDEAHPWPRELPVPQSVFALLQDWDACFAVLRETVDARLQACLHTAVQLADIHAHAPIAEARQLICTGANYRKHVIDLVAAQGAGAESEGQGVAERRARAAQRVDARAANGVPYAFSKLVTSIAGPQDDIVVPRDAEQFDWELELGVVLGRHAYRLREEEAAAAVAGYVIVNDLTRRELVYREDLKSLGSDWLRAKGGPGFMPMGPLFVPAPFVQPESLRIHLALNGETMQDESTADMLFGIARQLAYVTAFARLLPGDVLATGSPAGNGMHHGRFLRPGDEVVASITGLGSQRCRCVAEEV